MPTSCDSCGSPNINDYGGCNACGTALTLEGLSLSGCSTPAKPFVIDFTADDHDDFAENFTSPTFELVVGGLEGSKRTKFYVHKSVLESQCPYFRTLFSTRLPTTEMAENSITLDSAIDGEKAWRKCIQYLYTGTYSCATGGGDAKDNDKGKMNGAEQEKKSEWAVNAGVYVLAEKLCMDGLKTMALDKMAEALTTAYGVGAPTGNEIAAVVEVVYTGTGDHEEHDSTEGDAAAEKPEPSMFLFTGGAVAGNKGEKSPKTSQPVPDPMRTLVARYAASRIVELRKDQEFLDIVRDWGEFARDLVMRVGDGKKINAFTLQNILKPHKAAEKEVAEEKFNPFT